jgi:hypothetical protein
MDADGQANLQTSTAYADDPNEIYADTNIGQVKPLFKNKQTSKYKNNDNKVSQTF